MGGDGRTRPHQTSSAPPFSCFSPFEFSRFPGLPAFPLSGLAVILVTLAGSVTMRNDARLAKPDPPAFKPPGPTIPGPATDALVEEQLRNLDGIRKSAAKCELSLEHIGRKLEGIEFRLSRLDATVQQRMDKMNGTFLNKALKEDLAFDQLSRKLDAQYERISRKIGFLEAANDRLQTASDSIQSRIELQERSIKTEFSNISAALNETNRHSLETRNKLMQSFQNSTLTQEEKLKVAIKNLESKIGSPNCTVSSIGPKDSTRGTSGSSDQPPRREGGDSLAMNLIKKVTALHDEFKRHGDRVESLLQETLSIANITKKKIVLLSNEQREMQNESSQNYMEVALEALLNLVKRRMSELEEQIETKSHDLMNAQQSFTKSCNRIQEDEERIELRLTFVLEKILDTCDNRSVELNEQVEKLVEELKTQGRNTAKNIAHTNSLVVRLDEETSSKNKHIEASLAFVTDSSNQIRADIQDLRTNMNFLLNETTCTKTDGDSFVDHLESQGSESYDKLSDGSEMADGEDFSEEDDSENEFDSHDVIKEEKIKKNM
ncbi:unnamed protein product [Bemisia tabaci]|uniref:Uncharacterized protein n=2 Tax=Bemisia tabaci TaxID=7038 RepID=A0A9P0F883_BEMTA|nr:unnamed protein product [Bemisia tabaci]